MTKREFLKALWSNLSQLPKEDVERTIDYYNEMIDERIENGMTEEEAVADVGPVEDAAKQIISELPKKNESKNWAGYESAAGAAPEDAYYRTDTAPASGSSSSGYGSTGSAGYSSTGYSSSGYSSSGASYTAPRKSGGLSGGKLALLICLFPIWLPLVITAGALVFSFYVVLWALAVSLFAAGAAFIGSTFVGIISAAAFVIHGRIALGLFYLGGGLILGGLGILIFLFGKKIITGAFRISRAVWRGIFKKKEAEA